MQQEIVCIPELRDIRGLESILTLKSAYTEVRHNLFKKHPLLDNFLKLVKSTLSFLGNISQVQTGPWKPSIDFH